MKHWNEDFVSDITFTGSSFNSRVDVINPKLGQRKSGLVFHVQIVIERWRSTAKENLKRGFHFWKHFLRILKFRPPFPSHTSMVRLSTQSWFEKGPKLVSHVVILIERSKSKVKGTLRWGIYLWNYFLEIVKF